MKAEPFIFTTGPRNGEIDWGIPYTDGRIAIVGTQTVFVEKNDWLPYAEFERQKQNELMMVIQLCILGGYTMGEKYTSSSLIGYSWKAYLADTESGRLLKRAEFLKAVCDRQGINFLPTK